MRRSLFSSRSARRGGMLLGLLPGLLPLAAFLLGARRVRRARPARPPSPPKGRFLDRYLGRRLVILNEEDDVYSAARAMEANAIGAVLVERGGRIVGIVTDRDLLLYFAHQPTNAHPVPLRDVMSVLSAVVSPGTSVEDVAERMERFGVRRVPILGERGEARGLVTLDDLLVDGLINIDQAGAILRRQLSQPAEFKVAGQIGLDRPARPWSVSTLPEDRRASRADSTLARALDLIGAETRLRTRASAEEAFFAVMGPLLRRVMPQEASDLLAQLPLRLRERCMALPPGPDSSIGPETIRREVRSRLNVRTGRIDEIIRGVIRALSALVSPGEFAQFMHQLPREMREWLEPDRPISGWYQ